MFVAFNLERPMRRGDTMLGKGVFLRVKVTQGKVARFDREL